MGGVRKDKVKNLIQLIMEKFNDGNYVFEITNEFPDGYEIWAIGRRNFEHKGYVPFFSITCKYINAIKVIITKYNR